VELGGNMRLLVQLCLFEAVVAFGEVSTAILAIRVQEEVVEPGRQIIMVRDVLLRAAFLVVGPQPTERVPGNARARFQILLIGPILESVVPGDEIEQVVDVPLLQQHAPIHIGLARAERRRHHDLARGRFVREADMDRRTPGIRLAIAILLATHVGDNQFALLDKFLESPIE